MAASAYSWLDNLYASDEFVETFTVGFIRRCCNNAWNSARYTHTLGSNAIFLAWDAWKDAESNDNDAKRQVAIAAYKHGDQAWNLSGVANGARDKARSIMTTHITHEMDDETIIDSGVAVEITIAVETAANACLAAHRAAIATNIALGVVRSTDTSRSEMEADFAQRIAANAVRVHQLANAFAASFASSVRIQK